MPSKSEAAAAVQVGATGVSVAATLTGNVSLAEQLEAAQVQAIRECYDKGTTDTDSISAAMAAARDAVLNG